MPSASVSSAARSVKFAATNAKQSAPKKSSTRAVPSAPSPVVAFATLKRAEDIFADLGELRALEGEVYRAVAYENAVVQLRKLRLEAETAQRDVTLAELKATTGVGDRIVAKIEEIQGSPDGATLQEHTALVETDFAKSARFIMAVHGFGPKIAGKLAKEHGGKIQTLDALKAIADAEQFHHAQLLGIKYHADASQRIPRAEMTQHVARLDSAVQRIDPELIVTVCGSYRRELPTSGDIDCLLTYPVGGQQKLLTQTATPAAPVVVDSNKRIKRAPPGAKADAKDCPLGQFMAELQREQYVLDVLGQGTTKAMAYARLEPALPARRLDVRWVAPEEYPTALLYFTGSSGFNARMRHLALAAGYTLNEYGLFHLSKGKQAKAVKTTTTTAPKSTKGGKRVPVTCEKDVFDAIGMPYVEPVQRTD
jgi:DNA polymerase beta